MKKLAWILVLAMLLSCLVACGGAKTELEKAFTTVNVDGGLKIVAYNGNHTKLEIPSTIGKKTVVEIGDEVFAQSYLLTEIVIPDTVHTIGNRAFQRMPSRNSCGNAPRAHLLPAREDRDLDL